MTDEKKDASILELLKSVQVWVATLAGLVTAISSAKLLIDGEPRLGVLLISGVGVSVLWLMLGQAYRRKEQFSTHDASKKRYKYSKRQRAWALAGMILLPALESVLIYMVTRPPHLPDDKLVVLYANFTPVSGAGKAAGEAASRFTYELGEKLLSRSEDIPLQPKVLGREIKASNPSETPKEVALRLGKSREGLAHIVLWGDVVENIKDFTIKPSIAFTESLGPLNISELDVGWFPRSNAGSFQLEDIIGGEPAARVADLVTFIEGLMYFKLGRWNKAKEIFDQLSYPIKAVEYYKGLCLYEMAQKASDPQPALQDARSAFLRALGDPPWKLKEELNCAAFLNMTSVVAMLSSSRPLKSQLDQLREVASAYNTALEHCPEDDPQNLAVIKNNLGNVLVDSALLAADETQMLQQAADAYNEAIPAFRSTKDCLNLAIAQNNLGTAYTELGLRIRGQTGDEYLKNALDAYGAALRVLTYKKSKNYWVTINVNRSQALTEMGRREGGNGNGRIRDAVESCRAALEAISQKKTDAANAGSNLANALREQARRKPGADGDSLLREAKQLCSDAVAALPEGDLEWVVGQERLGDLFVDQAMRPNNNAADLLRKAVEAYHRALSFRDTTDHNQDWANTQNRLGIALTELARSDNGDQARHLDEALASFDYALSIFDEANYPEQHREVIDNQSKARALK